MRKLVTAPFDRLTRRGESTTLPTTVTRVSFMVLLGSAAPLGATGSVPVCRRPCDPIRHDDPGSGDLWTDRSPVDEDAAPVVRSQQTPGRIPAVFLERSLSLSRDRDGQDAGPAPAAPASRNGGGRGRRFGGPRDGGGVRGARRPHPDDRRRTGIATAGHLPAGRVHSRLRAAGPVRRLRLDARGHDLRRHDRRRYDRGDRGPAGRHRGDHDRPAVPAGPRGRHRHGADLRRRDPHEQPRRRRRDEHQRGDLEHRRDLHGDRRGHRPDRRRGGAAAGRRLGPADGQARPPRPATVGEPVTGWGTPVAPARSPRRPAR